MERHWFVPGLLGPVPGGASDAGQPAPNLERLLARSDRQREPVGYDAALCGLFGITRPAGGDLPTAAIVRFGETGDAPEGFVMHADPLQLLPDRDSVLAFGLDDDGLSNDELGELLEAFNRHFGDEGLRLHGRPGGQLYLHCEHPPLIRTHPLSSVIGRNLDRYLPEGEHQRRWRNLLNETQMLCHAMAFNQTREVQGRATVAGLWFSGGGTLPDEVGGEIARVIGDCPLAAGLVALGSGSGDSEVIIEHAAWRALLHADAGDWTRSVGELDRGLPGWQQGCAALYLHPCNGDVYRWHTGADWRFWRRRRPLANYQDRVASGQRAQSGPGV
jgi:hypothetical protein